jgi:FkbM family methyltransferase
MFRLGIYDTDLEPDSVNYVVDLGGNVGYTCLLWCWRYPRARVLTFEPNPTHSEILNWHVQVNHYSKRVAVIAAGASSHDGSAAFVDADVWSRVVSEGEPKPPNSLTIKLVDFFAAIGNDPIDILKIDIEGGEYDIMNDVRFDAVARRCRIIIMEWHQFDPSQPGGAWCTAKLESLGFGVQQTNAAGNIGLLVARKLKSADFPQTNGTPHKV